MSFVHMQSSVDWKTFSELTSSSTELILIQKLIPENLKN